MSIPSPDSLAVVAPASGGLPMLALLAPDGARAQVYLYGGHVVSWVPSGGEERLFLSGASAFRSGAPIRGGVPVAFPQFGANGPLPLHGLVRLMSWDFISADLDGQRVVATFRVSDTSESRRLWDHPFRVELAVGIGGSELSLDLSVTNTGAGPFDFTAALHTYIAVSDVEGTWVEGLSDRPYRDAAAGGVDAQQQSRGVGFAGEVNRVYFDAPAEARVVEGARTTLVRKSGFADVVVWNPGAARCATVPDLEPDDYRRFVCVEAVALGTPIQLAPGERWRGNQTLLA